MSAPDRDTRQPVLFIDSRIHFGGDVQVLLDMLRCLARSRRFAPILACPHYGDLTREARQLEGVRVVECDFGLGGEGAKPSRFRAVDKARAVAGFSATVAQLAALVLASGVRVVHCNNTARTLAVGDALKVLLPWRVRLVYHGHCAPQYSIPHRAARRLASEFWPVSEYTKTKYVESGIAPARLRVMFNALSEPGPSGDPAAMRRELGVPDGAALVMLIGRVCPNKGQHIAVDAFGLLPGEVDAHLVLVGDDSIPDDNEGYVDRLRARVDELGLGGRVHFAGFRRDIWPLLAASDLVLVPSENEFFGMTAIEAVAAGRPLVAARRSSLVEVVESSIGIPTVDRTAQAFSAAIRDNLVNGPAVDPAEATRRANAHFGMNQFAFRLDQAIDELAGNSTAPLPSK